MKKLQYNYLPAESNNSGRPTKINPQPAKSSTSNNTPAPPDEATISRLNAIAQEYPFCVYFKQSDISLL